MLLLAGAAKAQQDVDEDRVHQIIDELLEETDDDTRAEDLAERLFFLYENPLDLNTVTADEMGELFFLLQSQIHGLLGYREKYGPILSLSETLVIEGFDQKTMERMAPFVSLESERVNRKQPGNHSLLFRLENTIEKKKGYVIPDTLGNQTYAGPPYKGLLKYRSFRRGRYSAGLTLENDAGESLKWDPRLKQYGADFLSFHLALENKGIFDKLMFGDYQVNIGQGLIMGQAFSAGKNSDAVGSVRKTGGSIKPYTGSQEANFFRGVGAGLHFGKLYGTAFFSYKKRDGRLACTSDSIPCIRSISQAGMHRTGGEIGSRNVVGEFVYGGDVSFLSSHRRFEAGVNLVMTHLTMPLIPDPAPYNRFSFSGSDLLNCGLRFSYAIRNFSFFNEFATSDFRDFGGLTGFQAILSPEIALAATYRNYGRSYHTFYTSAFSEAATQNEEGFYWGLRFNMNKRWHINLYYDLFRFHWLRYQVYSLSSGSEFLLRINYELNEKGTFYFQFKTEEKMRNAEDKQPVTQTAPIKKHQYQVNLDVKPSSLISLKFRIQMSNTGNGQGMALVNDLNFYLGRFKWQNRFAIFEADDYDNRLYIYEKDVLHAFSFPAYQGTGTRYYTLLEFKATGRLTVWAKLARTHYKDRQTIGSGPEEIEGNHKTDVKLQVRYAI